MNTSKFTNVPAHQASLTFRFNQPVNGNSNVLELGKLKLSSFNQNLLYSTTSGLPRFQNLASSKLRGKGRIPTCLQAGIISYSVKTTPVYLPDVKGVNGNFYPILPFAVSVGEHQRSDLGIHMDRNVPGSAGCLVITLEDHWRQFQLEMEKLRVKGIMEIPLMVF